MALRGFELRTGSSGLRRAMCRAAHSVGERHLDGRGADLGAQWTCCGGGAGAQPRGLSGVFLRIRALIDFVSSIDGSRSCAADDQAPRIGRSFQRRRGDDQNVLVLGAGSAGLIAAISLKGKIPQLAVRVVRSPDIGVIGVGEGTTPNFPDAPVRLPRHQPQALLRAGPADLEARHPLPLGAAAAVRLRVRPRARLALDRPAAAQRLLLRRGVPLRRPADGADGARQGVRAAAERRRAGHPAVARVPHREQEAGRDARGGRARGRASRSSTARSTAASAGRRASPRSSWRTGGGSRPTSSSTPAASAASCSAGRWKSRTSATRRRCSATARWSAAGTAGRTSRSCPTPPPRRWTPAGRGGSTTSTSSTAATSTARRDLRRRRGAPSSSGRTRRPRESPRVVKFRSGRYRAELGGQRGRRSATPCGFVEPLEATALMVVCSQSQTLVDFLLHTGLSPTPTIRDLYNHMVGEHVGRDPRLPRAALQAEHAAGHAVLAALPRRTRTCRRSRRCWSSTRRTARPASRGTCCAGRGATSGSRGSW